MLRQGSWAPRSHRTMVRERLMEGLRGTVQCCRACSADSAYVWHGRAASPMHDRQRDHGIRGGDWRRVWRRPINAGDRWQGGVKMAGGREEQQTSIQDRGRGGDCLSPLLAAQPQAHNPQGLPLSRSWFRPSWPAVGRRLPSRRQKPSGPLSSTSRPRPMDATHTHMRLAGGAEDMGAKDGGDGREDCVWSSTTRDRWLSPRDFVSLSPRPSRRERRGEHPAPPMSSSSVSIYPALVSLVDPKG